MIKSINMNEHCYSIWRDDKNNYNDIITIQLIKDSIKALELLFNIKEYKIILSGYIGNRTNNIEVLKLNNSTIEIMDYNNKYQLVKTKIKVNEIERIEAFPNMNLKVYTYYNNFIDKVEIYFKR